jgi:hypothetical protein
MLLSAGFTAAEFLIIFHVSRFFLLATSVAATLLLLSTFLTTSVLLATLLTTTLASRCLLTKILTFFTARTHVSLKIIVLHSVVCHVYLPCLFDDLWLDRSR